MKHKRSIIVLSCLMLLFCSTAMAEAPTYRSLCDGQGLQSADVIAWLEIPGASLCEPIMRHTQDDAYYATRDAAGNVNQYGSLYVQAQYNTADCSDAVILVYGSSETEQAPFGMLQQTYSAQFDQCRQLYLHTPQGSKEYVVFAAVPYTSTHILHYYHFGLERQFNSFFDDVFSIRALAMHLDESNRPVFEQDQVVILSTRLRGDPLQRYLVMAKEV